MKLQTHFYIVVLDKAAAEEVRGDLFIADSILVAE